jgi:hypothetical protein
MIGYYIHHHGSGHLTRATSICAQMQRPVTALSSLDIPEPHPFTAVMRLPRDDEAEHVREPSAHGALHWAPHHDGGYRSRMTAIAQWVADTEPEAVVVDVSVEVATFVRLLGVPVIVMALPGDRVDAPHQLVHRLADHIVAAWPGDLNAPAWLRPYRDKASYVGGISRFEGRSTATSTHERPPRTLRVLALGGTGDTFGDNDFDGLTVDGLDVAWSALGGGGSWVSDPWPQICAADVVVTHAGQGCIADVAAAERPAVVIPSPRPFDEQSVTATVLREHRLAVVAPRWPDRAAWPALLAEAMAADPSRWRLWQVHGAAARAASAIETTARRGTEGDIR